MLGCSHIPYSLGPGQAPENSFSEDWIPLRILSVYLREQIRWLCGCYVLNDCVKNKNLFWARAIAQLGQCLPYKRLTRFDLQHSYMVPLSTARNEP